ncbi:MAG TPA: transcription termination factor Rho [Myxococcales bacterium]|jgi:transcription termination factor Rho|nr:transcription termination factor Rho [Myxococcales bacterium]
MNGEGQRPPGTETQPAHDTPEPGNARYPQNTTPNGQQQQSGEGGGRRRFRRQRRGGRGRGRNRGQHQQNVQAPLDAQGRILDVENDVLPDDGGPDAVPQPGEPQAIAAQGDPQGSQTGADIAGGPSAPPAGTTALGEVLPPQQPAVQPGQQVRQQQNQPRPQQQQQQRPQPRQEPPVPIEGVLDIDHRGNGRLRSGKLNFLPQPDDPDVPRHMIERDRLREGSHITGQAVRRNGRLQLIRTESVEGLPPQQAAARTLFQNLTVIDPDDRLVMETTPKETLTRIIDIVSPIGLGQRMLIVSPPKAGKTIMLQKMCLAISTNRPEVVQFVLLVDERPEEVTDFRRTVKAEVVASSADRPTEEHLHVAEMVLERSKRLVEGGKDVVILLDSITRLSRAYNKEVESSGRTLSGGVDSRALERPKRLFGAARNAEEGGSLTIIATALVDTGSRMDEVIFEEFKGTGNSEINLDRQLAEKRIWPAINIQTSGTRKEEKLFSQHEYEKVKKLRGALFALKPVEAMERLLKSVSEFNSNAEFLDAI